VRKILSTLAASALLVIGMSAPAFADEAVVEPTTTEVVEPAVEVPAEAAPVEEAVPEAVPEGVVAPEPEAVEPEVVAPVEEVVEEEPVTAPVVEAVVAPEAVVVPETQTVEPPVVVHYGPNHCAQRDTVRITGDGVLTVTGNWDEDSIDVTSQFSAAEGGLPTITSIGPSLNIDANPLQYVGIHIKTARGTIVFEKEPSYGGNLWSNVAWPGVPAGMGYPAFGTYQQFNDLNGGTAITGVSILYTHPQASSTKVQSFTVGCVTFKFKPVKHPQPTPPPTTPVTEPTVPAVVTPAPVVEPVVAAPVAAPVVAAPVAAAPTAKTTAPATLAATGSNAWWVAAIAGTLSLLGYGLFMVAAKRRQN